MDCKHDQRLVAGSAQHRADPQPDRARIEEFLRRTRHGAEMFLDVQERAYTLSQIAGVQASTAAAVEAIRRNTERMQEINRYTTAVAASVEQQSAATNEISHNVASAAAETKVVAGALEAVVGAVDDTGSSAATVLEVSHAMQSAAEELRNKVEGFLRKVAV